MPATLQIFSVASLNAPTLHKKSFGALENPYNHKNTSEMVSLSMPNQNKMNLNSSNQAMCKSVSATLPIIYADLSL